MKRINSKTVYEGRIIDVRIDEFRYDDGERRRPRDRRAPGCRRDRSAYDDATSGWSASRARLWMYPALLELPAGKLDVEGESHLECAQRELDEEIGQKRRASGPSSSASTRRRASPRRR